MDTKRELNISLVILQDSLESNRKQLVYWDIRGLAQPLRHLFEYLKITYIQTKITDPSKWYKQGIEEIGKKCLFPSLPYIVDNDFYLSEPISIAKYVCIKQEREDLLGKTLIDQAKVDELLAKYVIFNNKLADLFKPGLFKGGVKSQKLDNLFNELMNFEYFLYIIEVLKTKEWLFDHLTIADFFTYETVFYLTGIYYQKLEFHSQLFQFMRRFQSIAQVSQYNLSNRLQTNTFMGEIGSYWKGDPKYGQTPKN